MHTPSASAPKLTLLSAASLAFAVACDDGRPSGPPLTDIWSTLPAIEGTHYLEWSSHERGETPSFPEFPHGNKDFNNFLAVCGAHPELPWQRVDHVGPCEPPLSGYLIASRDEGPGVVARMYFTAGPVAPPSRATFGDERLRIYVDGHPEPVHETVLGTWHRGSGAFRAPLARYTSGALVSYRPIAYQSKLRIVLDRLRTDSIYYYHIDAREKLARPIQSAEAIEFMAANPAATSAQALSRINFVEQEWVVAPQESVEILERDSGGTIQQLTLSFATADSGTASDVRLQMTWDDASEPAVDLPLAHLFAGRHDLRPFRTLPMAVAKDAGRTTLTLMLPLPFERAARIVLRNDGSEPRTLKARIEGLPQLPAGNFGKLHATWVEATGPFTPAKRFRAAARSGEGKFVGLIMYMQGAGKADSKTPHPVSFLEGDATLTVDGRAMQGTGTEDYFNAGFYFQDGPNESAFGALVQLDADLNAGTGQVTVLRWNLLEEAIEFTQNFELLFEYGAYEPLAAQRYGAVAFYYVR